MAVYRSYFPRYVSIPREIFTDNRLSSDAKVILSIIMSDTQEDNQFFHYPPSHYGLTIQKYNEAMDELVTNRFVRAVGEYHYSEKYDRESEEAFSHFSSDDNSEDCFKHFKP